MKLLFNAEGIPAYGYKVVGLVNRKKINIKNAAGEMNDSLLENGFYRLEFENGEMTSLFDKECKREWAVESRQTAYLEVMEEGNYRYYYGKPHKAWSLGFTGEKAGLKYEGGKIIENNTIRTVLRQEYSYNSSKLQKDVILYHVQKRIDFEVRMV